MKPKNIKQLSVGLLLGLAFVSQGKELWTEGHGDIGAHYVSGNWNWTILHGGSPDDYIIALDNDGKLQVPDLPSFEFLGAPGDNIWIISQSEAIGVPFVGMSSDTPGGVFENNRFAVALAEFQGPGEFSMWTTSGSGQVNILMTTANGLSEEDFISMPAPGHIHQNWGFSSPGTYHLGFQASGTLQSNSETITSEVQEFEFAVNVLREGEVDIEVLYENGEWELALLSEATETEFAPDEAALHASPLTWTAVPADATFGFLGAVDSDLYILPQEEQEGVLYVGIAGDEIATGVFESDAVSLGLVTVEGPGNVFLYSTDAFGAPAVFFNSADGIDEMDVFPVAVGGHAHQNWAFSSPGVYRITVQASGTLVGGAETSSEPATFMFEVFGPTIFEQGELDLEVAYEEGELEVVALDEATETELELSDVVVRGLPESMVMIPEGASYEFLGTAGESIYILPQEEVEGLIYLGIAGDEIPADMFTDNNVTLTLMGVNGPGDTFLYSVDAFGEPTVFFNSADGVDASDVYPVAVGGHAHQNWAFSEAGVYEVQLQASGTLAADSSEVMSEEVTLRFHIVAPKTGTELMIALMDESTVQVSWMSMSGATYQLQRSADPAAMEWEPVGDPIPGTGEMITVDYSIKEIIAEFLRLQID